MMRHCRPPPSTRRRGRGFAARTLAVCAFIALLELCALGQMAEAVTLPSWSRVDIISSESGVACGCVDIDGKDRINLVWAESGGDGRHHVFFRRMSEDLEVINGKREIASTAGLEWLGCASDGANDLHVIYLDGTGIGYTKVSYAGLSIIRPKYVVLGTNISHLDMDVGKNRDIHMVCEESVGSQTTVVYRRLDRSGTPNIGPLVIGEANSTDPDICAGTGGQVVVTWLYHSQNRTELRFNVYSEDMSLSSQLMMSSTASAKSDPCATCDADGNRFVLWYDLSEGPARPSVQMSWADKGDTVWLQDRSVFPPGAYGGALVATAGRGGEVHILCYESAADDTLNYCMVDRNGRQLLAPLWLDSGQDASGKEVGPRYSIDTGSNGYVHVVWVHRGLRYVDSNPRDESPGALGPNTNLKMALIVIMIVMIVLINLLLLRPGRLRRRKAE